MFWTVKKAMYRIVQQSVRLTCFFLDWREPVYIKGAGSIGMLPETIKHKNISNVLIVTDKTIENLHLMDSLINGLTGAGIKYIVFNGVRPNPSVENMEDARNLYIKNNCDAIIGFGGGSSIDCAKGAAIRISDPKKSLRSLQGILKVRHKLPPVIAAPTTAGTGSEITVVTVVKDMATREKFAVSDPKVRPKFVVLDPELTLSLPPDLTATTGLDALTHAVEAFIGKSNTKYTAECARKAVKIIFQNIEKAYSDSDDIDARYQMLIAANLAGTAFTRAYVGYVHAIAHTLGGLYDTPHGFANSVILPHILQNYGKYAEKRLAELADIAGITSTSQSISEKSKAFIAATKEFNRKFGIPEYLTDIKEEDIPLIAKRAMKEANPQYPVPKEMNQAEFESIIRLIMGR